METNCSWKRFLIENDSWETLIFNKVMYIVCTKFMSPEKKLKTAQFLSFCALYKSLDFFSGHDPLAWGGSMVYNNAHVKVGVEPGDSERPTKQIWPQNHCILFLSSVNQIGAVCCF